MVAQVDRKRNHLHAAGMDFEAIVDTERYFTVAEYAATIAAARAALAEAGCAVVPAFVRPAALAAMLAEVAAVRPNTYRRDAEYTAYGHSEATGDERHPTRRTSRYAHDSLAADLFDHAGPLTTLFEDARFIAFVAAMLGEDELHPLGDPLLRLTVTLLGDGDVHGWHFDGNDFVVSLLLQPADDGGIFEYAPFVRSENEPNFATVTRLMDGDDTGLRRLRAEPGMLSIFCGKRALHRVSPVHGSTPRIMALFSYDRTPNVVHDEKIQQRVFGRVLQPA